MPWNRHHGTHGADRSAYEADRSEHEGDQTGSDADLTWRAERDGGTLIREAIRPLRARIADERNINAVRRDERARQRDITADGRDREAEELSRKLGDGDPSRAVEAAAAARAHADAVRAQARSDRKLAALDRIAAAVDRMAAALDREQLQEELERAHLDELTGTYRRGMGEAVMRHEIQRTRRSEGELVLAYVDVDGLKETNDRRGHPVGDDLLRDVVAALRSKLRPYDPLTRWGGDEFICAISDASVEDARRRLDEAAGALADARPGARFTAGIAALADGDTLETLIDRADRSLLDARRGR